MKQFAEVSSPVGLTDKNLQTEPVQVTFDRRKGAHSFGTLVHLSATILAMRIEAAVPSTSDECAA